MTKVAISEEIAAQIRIGEGPIELVDENGHTIGIVRRPPTQSEIDRARSRSSNGGERLSWDQLVASIKDEVRE